MIEYITPIAVAVASAAISWASAAVRSKAKTEEQKAALLALEGSAYRAVRHVEQRLSNLPGETKFDEAVQLLSKQFGEDIRRFNWDTLVSAIECEVWDMNAERSGYDEDFDDDEEEG